MEFDNLQKAYATLQTQKETIVSRQTQLAKESAENSEEIEHLKAQIGALRQNVACLRKAPIISMARWREVVESLDEHEAMLECLEQDAVDTAEKRVHVQMQYIIITESLENNVKEQAKYFWVADFLTFSERRKTEAY